MSEKVYPMQQLRDAPSPPVIGSSDSHSIALEMPERAFRKEQEQSLITNQYHSQRDAQAYSEQQLPAMAVAARRRRLSAQCSCFCCCLASFLVTLVLIVIIVGVAALVLYLVLSPKAPDFSITEASVSEFNLTSRLSTAGGNGSSSLYLNTDMIFSVEARNGNKKISLYYDDVQVKLLYRDQQIGAGSIPAFHQGHKNTTFLTLLIQGRHVSLSSACGSALQSSLRDDVSIGLQTRAASKARVRIGVWKSRRHRIHVDCSLQLSNPQTSPGAHLTLLSKACKFKIRVAFFHLKFS